MIRAAADEAGVRAVRPEQDAARALDDPAVATGWVHRQQALEREEAAREE